MSSSLFPQAHCLYRESPSMIGGVAGRSGRDGAPSKCTLLYAPADAFRAKRIIQTDQPGGSTKTAGRWAPRKTIQGRMDPVQELDRIISFCEEDDTCRRTLLLQHFGEPSAHTCLHAAELSGSSSQLCDVCLANSVADSGLQVEGTWSASSSAVSNKSHVGEKSSTRRQSSPRDAIRFLQSKFPAVTKETTIEGKYPKRPGAAGRRKTSPRKTSPSKRAVRSTTSPGATSFNNSGVRPDTFDANGASSPASFSGDYAFANYINFVRQNMH